MSIFDALELGASVLSAGNALKVMRQIQKENPEYHKVVNVLSKVCSESDLNFAAHGTKEGGILFKSDTLVRGLFNQPEVSCAAFTIPDVNITNFIYLPEESIFVKGNTDANFLLSWVNSQVNMGIFTLQREYRNNVGKDVVQLAYKIGIDHSNCPADELGPVFQSILDSGLRFREIFLPILDNTGNLDVQNLSMPRLNELAKEEGVYQQLRNNPISADELLQGKDKNISVVRNYLISLNIPWKIHESAAVFQGEVVQSSQPYSMMVFLTPTHVVTESMIKTIPSTSERDFILSEELVNANYFFNTGNVHLKPESGQVVYRIGLDHRKTPMKLIAPLLRNIFSAHEKAHSGLFSDLLGLPYDPTGVVEITQNEDATTSTFPAQLSQHQAVEIEEGRAASTIDEDVSSEKEESKQSKRRIPQILIIGVVIFIIPTVCCGAYLLFGLTLLGGR